MPISPQQISNFTAKAKAAGYSDDEIAAEISRKTYEVSPTGQTPAVAPGQMQSQPKVQGVSNTPPTDTLTETPPDLVGKVVDFGKSLVKPTLDYVQSEQERLKARNQGKNLGERVVASLNPEELVKQNILSTDKGRKAAANVASFVVPFGKGASLASKVIVPGAAVGGLSAASEEGANVGSVAKGAAGGAAGAGVLHGAGKVVGKAFGKVTKDLPERLMESVFKEPIKDTRAAIKGGQSLGKKALEKGTKGLTDEAIYKNSVEMLNQFEDQLQSKLETSKRIIPLGEIKETVAPLIKKYASAGNTSAVSNITNRLEALEQYHGKSIPAQVANELKRTLYDEARNGYGQLASENIEGVKAIAKGLKEAIAKRIPGANEINKELSFHGKIADSMVDKLARSGRNNIIGLTDIPFAGVGMVPGLQIPALAGYVAKKVAGSTGGKKVIATGLNKAGKVIEPVATKIASSPATQTVTGQIASRGGAKASELIGKTPEVLSSVTQEPNQTANNNEGNNDTHTSSLLESPGTLQATFTGYTPEELADWHARAIQGGDTAGAKQIEAMYNDEVAFQKNQSDATGKAKKYSEGDKKFLLAKNEATKAYDTLIGGKVTSGKFAAAGSGVSEFFGTQDADTTAFKAQLATARTAARNALLGANMSDRELESYLDAIFNYSNEPAIIKAKLETFIKSMQDYEDSVAGQSEIPEVPPSL